MKADDGDGRLRVLTLLNQVERGGAERFALALARGLDRTQFESFVCVTRDPPGPLGRDLLDAGVQSLWLKRGSRVAIWRWWPLVRWMRRHRFHVVHSHLFGSNIWGVLFGRLCGVPVVIATEHSWSYEGKPLRRFIDREWIGRFASAFVAVSENDRRRMVSVEGVAEDKTRIIGTALIPRPSRGTSAELRSVLEPTDRGHLVGTVCALRPEKRIDLLISAFRDVQAAIPDTRLVVIGDGPERPRLEEMARSLQLDQHVLFLGTREDVPDLLEALDAYVICSDREGRPLSLIEAMTARLPVVATAVGDIPIMAGDPPAAVLVPPDDATALARALTDLLSDPAGMAALGRAARARAISEFGFPACVGRWQSLYRSLAGAGPR